MKKMMLGIAFFSLFFQAFVYPQERMAVLPFRGMGEVSDEETTYLLLLREIERWNKYEIVPASHIRQALGDEACSEISCAVDIGKQVNAGKVVFGSLTKLGEKIIVQYTLAKVPSGKILLSDDASVLYVEDLDQVIKRVAASIVQQIPFARTVEVGLVTAQESQEPNTQKAQLNGGMAFGYLYPENGYGNKDRVFTWDFKSIYETPDFAVTGLFGIRNGVAMNVGGMYLFSRRDFSPFVGGGLGFHWVSHYEFNDYGYRPEGKKRGDGIEMLVSGGLLAFRTYNFRVLLNIDYSLTFNDYDDRALVLTIGIMSAGKKSFGIF